MYIGIDLGGTTIAGGLVDEKGTIIQKMTKSTLSKRGSDAVIDDIVEIIETLNHLDERVESIGIGIPGITDPHSGEVIACVNINWYNVPLRAKIQEKINLPVFIDNDATVAGVAEFIVAQKGQYKDAVILTLGTGIGGGILIDGKVVSGFHGIGSEIGHMIVGDNFYTCNCGHVGCLETFASSTAIIKYAKHVLADDKVDSSIRVKTGGNLEKINGKMIIDSAKEGDAVSNQVIDRLVKYLSIGIINVIAIIDPEIIVLGGGLSLAGDYLLDKVKKSVDELKYYQAAGISKIELAKLQNDAGIIGAAMYAKIHP